MATNIGFLPLYQATAGVATDEDWVFSIYFSLADGTPINLTNIDFTFTVSNGGAVIFTANRASSTNPVVVSGAGNNAVTLIVYKAQKLAWALGGYGLSLVATDGIYTRDIFFNSTLTVGAPQVITLTPIYNAGGGVSNPLLSAALFALLPNLQTGGSIPARGLPYINNSGFVVISQ